MSRHLVFVALVPALVCAWSDLAAAQQIFLTPSLSIREEYDSNVTLSATDAQSDFITAITPGLRLELRQHPWSIDLGGSVRGEMFATNAELNNFGDSGSATAAIEFQPTRNVTLSLTDTFVRSVSPLNVAVERRDVPSERALAVTGRFITTENTIGSSMRYQMGPLTLLDLSYSLNTFSSEEPQARDADTHEGKLAIERQLTKRASGTLDYLFSRFELEGRPSEDSHQPRVGWAYAFTPAIRLSLAAGPILREAPEGSEMDVGGAARYEQQFRDGALSLAYERTVDLAGRIGEPGVTQTLTLGTSHLITRALSLALSSVAKEIEESGEAAGEGRELRILTSGLGVTYQPRRRLTLGLESTVSQDRTSDEAVDLLTVTAQLQARYQLLRWLSVEAGYRIERQEDRRGAEDLDRQIFFFGLTATDRFRAY